MFTAITAWWEKQTPDQQRLWIQCLSVVVALVGILYPLYMFATTAWKDFHKEQAHFSGSSSSVKILPDDPAKQFGADEFENYHYVTNVYLDNNTSKDLHNVVVKLPKREGHHAVVDGNRNTLDVGKFQESVRLKQIPALSYYTIAFWYKDQMSMDEHVVINRSLNDATVILL